MKIAVHTGYDKAFQWINSGEIHFIGYLVDEPNLVPTPDRLNSLFCECKDFNEFQSQVKKLNGVFSIIYSDKNRIYAASDQSRFFPLFHTLTTQGFFISDDVEYVRQQTGTRKLNELAVKEFLSAAFTCQDRTLYNRVSQLQGGMALAYESDELTTISVHSLAKNKQDLLRFTEEDKQKKATERIDTAFERIFGALNDRQILLPLSGGIDSRLIACKLKQHNFTDVLCFTYGQATHEVEISKRVAQKLGFTWEFIEYTKELTKTLEHDPVFNQYFPYAARASSMFYLQEYPAIRELKQRELIKDNAVALPGHPGDLLRGSLLFSETVQASNMDDLPRLILKNKFQHKRLSPTDKLFLEKQLISSLKSLTDKSEPLVWSLQEDWELKERTSKYIMNSSHVFTFFGIPCYFPLIDKDLFEFFAHLPETDRLYGSFYKQVLFSNYFIPQGLEFQDDIQPSEKDYRRHKLKSLITNYIPVPIKEKRLQKNDWAAYGPMTEFMLREITEKGIDAHATGVSYLYRILNWYLEKIK